MKKLLIIMIALSALTGNAQKFILKDGDEWSYKKYPRLDTGEVIGLSTNLSWYYEEVGDIPTHDYRIYDVETHVAFTTEVHPNYSHLKKAVRSYSLVIKSDLEILDNITQSVKDHLASGFTDSEITTIQTLGIKINNKRLRGTFNQTDSLDEVYIEKVSLWYDQCRSEAESQISDYLSDGSLPSFQFTPKPSE